ncbi:hypothetical protein DUD43_13910 [Alcaligenes faecalis]|nr:hypothetical protein DUD43_13910 [Alcaligenes faecalis]
MEYVMTTKTRFTSSRIVLLSLTASLFSMTAQADLLGGIPLTIPTNLNLNQNLMTTTPPPGLFETGLGNVGQAVDNFAPLGLYQPAGFVGQAVDGQTTRTLDYFRRMRDALSLGYVYTDTVKPVVNTAQTVLDQAGNSIQQTPLPLNAGQAGGRLLTGLSDTVESVGALLQGDPNGPDPLISVVGHATGTVAAVTDSLFKGGNPPPTSVASRSPNPNIANTMATPHGPMETALMNTGQAADNILPFGMKRGGQYVGATLDGLVNIKELDIARNRILEAIDKGYVLNAVGEPITISAEAIDVLGNIIENANLPLNAGQAAGTLLHGVSDTVGSARGLLHSDPNNPYPISSTLENLTGSLAATTDALLHGGNQLQPLLGAQTTALNSNAGLLAPVTNLVDGLTGGLTGGNTGANGLLAPVTNLADSLTGGLTGGSEANAGLLAPVTNLVSSVTGGLGGDSANSQGLLAPITGLLGNGLLSPPAAATETPPGNTVAAPHVGLLSPVTGLVNGLLGAPPR